MKNLLNRVRKNNKGFSMVELIIVIVILAILVAVLAPQFIRYVGESEDATTENTASTMATILRTELASGRLTGSGTIVLDADVTSGSEIYVAGTADTLEYNEADIESTAATAVHGFSSDFATLIDLKTDFDLPGDGWITITIVDHTETPTVTVSAFNDGHDATKTPPTNS